MSEFWYLLQNLLKNTVCLMYHFFGGLMPEILMKLDWGTSYRRAPNQLLCSIILFLSNYGASRSIQSVRILDSNDKIYEGQFPILDFCRLIHNLFLSIVEWLIKPRRRCFRNSGRGTETKTLSNLDSQGMLSQNPHNFSFSPPPSAVT